MNTESLNCPGPPWEVVWGGVKRTRRSELVGVVILLCLETRQGNILCSNLYLKLANTPCLSFHHFCFFFYKIREHKRAEYVLLWGQVVGTCGKGEVAGKGVGGQ
jgi:hypothetical protein